MNWEKLFNTYGWPTGILLIVVFIFYKAIWPRISRYLDNLEKTSEDARQAIIKRADKLEEREDGLLNGFKEILIKQTERTDKQIEVLTEVATTVKDMNRRLK